MKITLDLDRLRDQGRISGDEYARLAALAAADASSDASSWAINLLVGFGTIAVAGGLLAFIPKAPVIIAVGLGLAIAGIAIERLRRTDWGLLGDVLLIVGGLMAAGGVLGQTDASATGFAAATALILVGAVAAKSRLLAGLAPFGILGIVGAATFYDHAPYGIAIEHPIVTILLFSLLSAGSYVASRQVPASFEPLAVVFSRVCLILTNFGFWIGSLWGDSLTWQRPGYQDPAARTIPDWAFCIVWAIGLVAIAVWGIKAQKRFVVNSAATFGAIHFFTQWFERLGANPLAIIVGGLLAIGIALALFRYNRPALRHGVATPLETA